MAAFGGVLALDPGSPSADAPGVRGFVRWRNGLAPWRAPPPRGSPDDRSEAEVDPGSSATTLRKAQFQDLSDRSRLLLKITRSYPNAYALEGSGSHPAAGSSSRCAAAPLRCAPAGDKPAAGRNRVTVAFAECCAPKVRRIQQKQRQRQGQSARVCHPKGRNNVEHRAQRG